MRRLNRRPSALATPYQRHFLLWLVLGTTITFFFSSRFLYSSVLIIGRSMEPSLREGDQRVVNHWAFRLGGLQRGDLVVLEEPESGVKVVKRIIALPGETIELRSTGVFVNNRPLRETYLNQKNRTATQRIGSRPLRLHQDQYFVMGDNRLRSLDSRSYGPVAGKNILGTVAP